MSADNLSLATIAGGCFWCLEADLLKVPGVVQATSGYAGGTEPNPTYEQVSTGSTGHLEAVQARFDPAVLPYADLVEWFWRYIDPTDPGGQFCDRGPQYRTAIFVHDEDQRRVAEASRARLEASRRLSRPVVTEILPHTTFHPAEGYHLRFFEQNPTRYAHYRAHCGRVQTLRALWGEEAELTIDVLRRPEPWTRPTEAELRARLSPLQYRVTRENGTEPPFANEYAAHKAKGIYVDVVSGEPLFSSRDKFDSGTGWPSFTRPLEPGNLVELVDDSLLARRTEVRSRLADSHLGHVFPDGPAPTHRRYCINSAALRFVPQAEMEAQGYGAYLGQFRE